MVSRGSAEDTGFAVEEFKEEGSEHRGLDVLAWSTNSLDLPDLQTVKPRSIRDIGYGLEFAKKPTFYFTYIFI